MQDILVEKVERDFIPMIKRFVFFLFLVLNMGCEPQPPYSDIPIIPFADIYIDLSLPAYSNLLFDGGYVEINGGVRGIILYRESANIYHAYERNCSYMPNEACATVNVDFSGLYMVDPCCNSSFSFSNGFPLGGPAFYGLREYQSYISGFELIITDFPVNN